MLTTPLGMFKRAACGELKPILRMRVEEYVVTTPDETDCF
jgi:hypothetical protein